VKVYLPGSVDELVMLRAGGWRPV